MARWTRKDAAAAEWTFTPLYDLVAAQYGVITAAVYGVVHRHCKMRKGVCNASTRRMAQLLGMDDVTVLRHLHLLVDARCLEDLTPGQRNKPHIYRDIYVGGSRDISASGGSMPGGRS